MPQETGGGAAIRPPRFGQADHFVRVGRVGRSLSRCTATCTATSRPHIRPAQGEEQIDLGGPAADFRGLDQMDDGLVLILGPHDNLQIDTCGLHIRGQGAAIADLRPAEADGAQRRIVQGEKGARRQRPRRVVQAADEGARRCGRDLLGAHHAQQAGNPGACPRDRRQAASRINWAISGSRAASASRAGRKVSSCAAVSGMGWTLRNGSVTANRMTAITRFAPIAHRVPPSRPCAGGAARPRGAGFGGRFLLRIEDIDPGRCTPAFTAAILEDLAWLGLSWEQPVRRQSAHMADYAAALARLQAMGLLYPCFCTRRQIRDEIARSGQAPHGPDGPLYPGTCKRLDPGRRQARLAAGDDHAWRLDMEAAARCAGPLAWHDRGRGPQAARPLLFGDVVLARKEVATSYHLAVTVDDAIQGVTLVTRGEDLLPATHVHRLLQALLDLPVPEWQHHGLLADAAGQRLAKRSDAAAIRAYRAAGHSPAAMRALAGVAD